jgi:hypothetical protein
MVVGLNDLQLIEREYNLQSFVAVIASMDLAVTNLQSHKPFLNDIFTISLSRFKCVSECHFRLSKQAPCFSKFLDRGGYLSPFSRIEKLHYFPSIALHKQILSKRMSR